MNAKSETPLWTVSALTLFPEMFPGPLAYSLAGQALKNGLWRLDTVDIRAYARDKHRCVDDTPFGGGAGMVLRADVLERALEAAGVSVDGADGAEGAGRADRPFIYLTPRGKPLTQSRVRELAAGNGVVLLSGRYEGIDERLIETYRPDEISLGDFVLSGGEPAAIALIDACVRLLPGVMGSEISPREESFEHGLLEYPHYTKPRVWRNMEVPEVLLSGHHEKVRAWRRDQAENATKERRPDLWERYAASKK